MLILIIFVFITLLLNPDIAALCVVESSRSWLLKLVPILYPNLIIVDLLLSNHSLSMISCYLFKPFHKIFGIRYYKSSLILILSIICGCPASTKMIKSALDNNDIDNQEANSLIYSTSCLSIPYVIYVLNLFEINIAFYYLLFIILMIITLRITNKGNSNVNYTCEINKISPLKTLLTSISNNINIMISILGIMIFFNIILSIFKVNGYIYPYFELLNGHIILTTLTIKKELKEIIAISSLSFLGISIHLQILFVYPDIKYLKFLFFRLISSLVISLCFFFPIT